MRKTKSLWVAWQDFERASTTTIIVHETVVSFVMMNGQATKSLVTSASAIDSVVPWTLRFEAETRWKTHARGEGSEGWRSATLQCVTKSIYLSISNNTKWLK